jgi:hypothetical protein
MVDTEGVTCGDKMWLLGPSVPALVLPWFPFSWCQAKVGLNFVVWRLNAVTEKVNVKRRLLAYNPEVERIRVLDTFPLAPQLVDGHDLHPARLSSLTVHVQL